MRPRLLHLGYALHGSSAADWVLKASMRPRLLHLGYALADLSKCEDDQLQ